VAGDNAVTQMEGLLAECDVRVDASPETVFEFFVDPEKMVRWMGVRAEIEPRPGGSFRVWVSEGWIASGEYTEVDRPRVVAFTWGWENAAEMIAPGSSLVRVTLEADGDQTIVKLRHSGLESEEARASHDEGWRHFLGRLAVAGAGKDPGPDPWATGAPS
jgi:uncharacterized protein YndB with AHSA1/START domain